MKRKVATPAGSARAEDPGANEVSEAAEVVPAESVHLKRNEKYTEYLQSPQRNVYQSTRIHGNIIYNIQNINLR